MLRRLFWGVPLFLVSVICATGLLWRGNERVARLVYGHVPEGVVLRVETASLAWDWVPAVVAEQVEMEFPGGVIQADSCWVQVRRLPLLVGELVPVSAHLGALRLVIEGEQRSVPEWPGPVLPFRCDQLDIAMSEGESRWLEFSSVDVRGTWGEEVLEASSRSGQVEALGLPRGKVGWSKFFLDGEETRYVAFAPDGAPSTLRSLDLRFVEGEVSCDASLRIENEAPMRVHVELRKDDMDRLVAQWAGTRLTVEGKLPRPGDPALDLQVELSESGLADVEGILATWWPALSSLEGPVSFSGESFVLAPGTEIDTWSGSAVLSGGQFDIGSFDSEIEGGALHAAGVVGANGVEAVLVGADLPWGDRLAESLGWPVVVEGCLDAAVSISNRDQGLVVTAGVAIENAEVRNVALAEAMDRTTQTDVLAALHMDRFEASLLWQGDDIVLREFRARAPGAWMEGAGWVERGRMDIEIDTDLSGEAARQAAFVTGIGPILLDDAGHFAPRIRVSGTWEQPQVSWNRDDFLEQGLVADVETRMVRTARQFEEALGLPAGILDRGLDVDPVADAGMQLRRFFLERRPPMDRSRTGR